MDEHKLSRRLLLQGLGAGLVSVASIAYAKKKATPGVISPPTGGANQVISGQTFSGGTGGSADPFLNLSGVSNRTYSNCTFENSGRGVLKGNAGQNVTFENCIFRNIKMPGGEGSLIFYAGTSSDTTNNNYGLVIRNNQFIDCSVGDIFELKCSGTKILNNTFTGCKGGVRIRHGVGTWVCGNKGLKDITVRCGPHEIHGNPDAIVTVFAGNLPGRYEEWIKLHVGGGGNNLQCAYRANCSGNKLVIVGKPSGKLVNLDKYPAKECNIAPGDAVQLMTHIGTTRNATSGCPQT